MTLLVVAAAAVIEAGRLLVVSKRAAPEVFYLPGGKPEPELDRTPQASAELAGLAWTTGRDRMATALAPAVSGRVIPSLVDHGLLPGRERRPRVLGSR